MRVLRLSMFGALASVAAGCHVSAGEVDKAGQVDEAARLDVREALRGIFSRAWQFRAPAGELPTTRDAIVDGVRVAVLPNGRLLTPAGVEVDVTAPKPYGMALSPDGKTLATINSGASRFSVSLIRNLDSAAPVVQRVDVNATFMGVVFSSDSSRFYASGGENGNIWVGDTATAKIIGSVNLNGTHPLARPLNSAANPPGRFKGAFPGNMLLGRDGRYLYVVDQAGFRLHVIDTTKVVVGTDAQGFITEPDNFAAVTNAVPVGRYPYAIAQAPDAAKLLVANVGVFQYTHLRPPAPTGDSNVDYPLCYPGAGYPNETLDDTVLKIKRVDPRNLPPTLQDPEGIRCGYVPADMNTPALHCGVELRLRRDLISDDPKRAGHTEPVTDFRAAPLMTYALGPFALTALAGVSVVEELEAIGTPGQTTRDHAGVLALAGIAGVL